MYTMLKIHEREKYYYILQKVVVFEKIYALISNDNKKSLQQNLSKLLRNELEKLKSNCSYDERNKSLEKGVLQVNELKHYRSDSYSRLHVISKLEIQINTRIIVSAPNTLLIPCRSLLSIYVYHYSYKSLLST